MQIVSASRRTDIPAFYAEWLMNRLREGYALVPNPFNSRQVSRTPLRPEQVACLVLVTKDPRPMLPHIDELERRGYRFCFQVTATGLPRFLEPGVPEAPAVIAAIRELSTRLGSGRVTWRFDPILLSGEDTPDAPVRTFAKLAHTMEGLVDRVIVSFAREYATVKTRVRRVAGARSVRFLDLDPLLKETMASALAEEAARRGMKIQSCAEPQDLAPFGISAGKCLDPELIKALFGIEFPVKQAQGQQSDCLCARSVDLGIYGTCPHRCLYCYASCNAALSRGAIHDPTGPALLAGVEQSPDGQLSLRLPCC